LEQFAKWHRIHALWKELTKATDLLLAQVAADFDDVTVIAVGGYGRASCSLSRTWMC